LDPCVNRLTGGEGGDNLDASSLKRRAGQTAKLLAQLPPLLRFIANFTPPEISISRGVFFISKNKKDPVLPVFFFAF